jgi:cytochrome c-type biogenesis protein CcmH
MMIFFLLATLLISVTLWSIHVIWTYRKKANLTSNNADWQVMVAKRNEIENDVLLTQQTQIALRNEWIGMADAVLARDQKPTQPSNALVKNYNTFWILIPSTIGALLIYFMLGKWHPEALRLHIAPTLATSSDKGAPIIDNPLHPGSNDSIETLISQLEKKLQESPDHIDGWVLLARSLGIKRDFSGATFALENALKLAPGHPDILADLADMVAMTNNKSLAGRPTQLIQEALKNAPDHPKALSLAATAAMQANDLKGAESYWKRLRATFPADAPDVAKINAIIAGLHTSDSVLSNVSDQASNKSIEGRVMLSPKFRDMLSKTKLAENATLFIIAKSPSGPPMPLAVARFPAQQLMDNNAIAFTLDDSQAMSPMLKLSSQSQVNLEARISMSGTASKQAGDLYVTLPDVKLGATNLLLEIQSVL